MIEARSALTVRLVLLFLAAGLGGCESQQSATREKRAEHQLRSAILHSSAPTERSKPPRDECAERARLLSDRPELPGTPQLDLVRAELLARARNVPLVFSSNPLRVEEHARKAAEPSQVLQEQHSDDRGQLHGGGGGTAEAGAGALDPATAAESAGAEDAEGAQEAEFVERMRRRLHESQRPLYDVQEILRLTRGNLPLRRRIFLSEQLLYAEQPEVALRMSQVLRLDHLFDEPRVEVRRGPVHISALREQGRYFLPDESPAGATTGRKQHGALASLLLFDQVKLPEEEWRPRLGYDLRPLQEQLAFDTAEVLVRSDSWVLQLRTRGVPSTVILRPTEEGSFDLVCETTPQPATLKEARRQNARERSLYEPVLEAADEMIARRLPFDEPRTEEGQQDGLLRIQFRHAYRRYRSTYEFNGDEYYVFDGYGRPRLPQVCIDFITDAFDWGTGGHWPNRGEKRLRVSGALHFPSMGIENPRSVENLLEFALETPSWFDVHQLPPAARVPFLHRARFFAQLAEQAEAYQLGDIVFIYGLKDDGKFHYHSFLIAEKDPLTGMPLVVAANAGPPQARSWEGEMHNAPLRKIVARVRVRPEIMERAHAQKREQPGVPLEPPPSPAREPDSLRP